MGKIVWVRPSGTEITTNDRDETIKVAAELGWKPKEQAKEIEVQDEPRKSGRPRKAD